MQSRFSYRRIALSSVLVAMLGGCGGGVTTTATSSSSASNNNIANSQPISGEKEERKVSPFVAQTLRPGDMPNLEEDVKSFRYTDVDISVDQKVVASNGVVRVNLKNMPGRYDWVGLFYKGDESVRNNLLTYEWTGDYRKNASVELRIANTLRRRHKGEIEEGSYEVRAFTRAGRYIELASMPIKVINQDAGEFNPTISVENSPIVSDEKITVALHGLAGFNGEWIGIFPKGSDNSWENAYEWEWTESAVDGEITLEGVPVGEYDIRVFYDEDMELESSVSIEVVAQEDSSVTLTPEEESFEPGERIVVHFAGMAGNADDWIGIFSPDANNEKESSISLEWTDGQTSGDISFDAIDQEGTYEVRAFRSGEEEPVAVQKIVVAEAKPEAKKVALFADEHDPHNRLLAVDYENMELVAEINVEGSLTHHADVVGDVDTAKYVLMVPKGSTFINVYSVKDKTLVKKIELPFKPRSADAFNASKNLVLLTSSNRPAAVLLDAKTWEIVGEAGMNITCDLKFNDYNYLPWYYKRIVYSWKKIPTDKLTCVAPDFGGQQISGHPAWLGKRHFAILDRANRLVHVYKLVVKKNGKWKVRLTDSVPTSTSLHQMIPSGHNDGIYYGMTEGNGNGSGIAPVIYKWKLVNGKLKQLAKTRLVTTKTVTMMKEVGAYDLYQSYWKRYRDAKEYYKYRYPTYFPQQYDAYYPGDQNKYYTNYYSRFKHQIANDAKEYTKKVPVQVQQQLNSLGGHNLYISPAVNGREYLWGAVASGQTFVVDAQTMQITAVVKSDQGAGHVNFQQNGDYAVITNHQSRNVTIANYKTQTFVTNINLPYEHENIFGATQSHSPYITLDDNYFHNTWTDGGVFFRINLNTLKLDENSLYTGGTPIQGNYYPHYNGD